MLSHKVLTRQDVGKVAGYYRGVDESYWGKDGGPSEWQGKGASILGLQGEVEERRFGELLQGQVESGKRGIRMSTRHDRKERIGLDLTFSPPKSVSLQALIHGDAAIVIAHDRAVARALEHAEQRAQVREKVDGKSRLQATGNVIAATFRHETTREHDPQLHTHCVLMNLTLRGDGKWRALTNDEIVKSVRYLEAVYNSELAAELQKAGYALRHGPKGDFELAHITRAQIEAFSKRAPQIKAYLESRGLTAETASMAQRQAAVVNSRAAKTQVEQAELHAQWKKTAREIGIDFAKSTPAAGHHVALDPQIAARPAMEAAERSLRWAIAHLTERQAIVEQPELFRTAIEHGMGTVRHADIAKAAERMQVAGRLIKEATVYRPAADQNTPGKTHAQWIADLEQREIAHAKERVDRAIQIGGLVMSDARYTTQAALQREATVLNIERTGRGAVNPIMDAELARVRLAMTKLNAGQRESVLLIATTSNRVVGIQGYAGTGKSHMLKQTRSLIAPTIALFSAQGYTVQALAPYATQVRALRELGVESNTLASWLTAKDRKLDAKTVLVIDEAGVVPSRLMAQALQEVEKAGARVVLLGDTAQTKAIEAGCPFAQLQGAGMATAHMDEIQRQKNARLKEAAELAAIGKADESLLKLTAVHEIKDDGARWGSIAARFAGLSKDDRDKTLIVSGTNEARHAINGEVRRRLGLVGKGVEHDTLSRQDTTQAERRLAKSYRIGDIIQPERDYPKLGLKRGELYTVTDNEAGNRLAVRSVSGDAISFSPMVAGKLSVYKPQRTELAPGDYVRITRNDARLDLANGDRFEVAAVSRHGVTLRNSRKTVVLPTDKPLHLDHAYATTVHSSQGLTCDHVLIDAHSKSRTTAKDVYYVAVTRAMHEAEVFTNDAAGLRGAVMRENVKHAAMDLQLEKHQHREHARA